MKTIVKKNIKSKILIKKKTTPKKHISKIDIVLNHLKKKNSITSSEALRLYEIDNLSDVIYNIRKKGVNITSIDVFAKNKKGKTVKTSKYILTIVH